MLLGSSKRTQNVQQHRNLLLEGVGIDVVEAKLCRERRNGWTMSVACVGLDAISTSLPLREASTRVMQYSSR